MNVQPNDFSKSEHAGVLSIGIKIAQHFWSPGSPLHTLSLQGNCHLGFWNHRLVLPGFELHIDGIPQGALFCIWFPLLNAMFERFMHLAG